MCYKRFIVYLGQLRPSHIHVVEGKGAVPASSTPNLLFIDRTQVFTVSDNWGSGFFAHINVLSAVPDRNEARRSNQCSNHPRLPIKTIGESVHFVTLDFMRSTWH